MNKLILLRNASYHDITSNRLLLTNRNPCGNCENDFRPKPNSIACEYTQKPSLFTTILDMAALEKTGSRAGSLSLENENVSSQTHLLYNHPTNGEVDHTSLATLARRSTM